MLNSFASSSEVWIRKAVQEVGKILPVLFRRQVQRADPQLIEILAPLWSRVAGKAIARHSRPITFESGTLTLLTSCPSWATQLRNMAEEIRAEINGFLGGAAVKKLRVQLAPDLEPAATRPAAREFIVPAKTGRTRAADGWAKLDPETARILERPFAKYSARSGRKVH